MTLDSLQEQIGYIEFTFEDGACFYVKTSFNSSLCKQARDNCVHDLLTGKDIPRRVFETASFSVTEEEPIEHKDVSEFWKQFL